MRFSTSHVVAWGGLLLSRYFPEVRPELCMFSRKQKSLYRLLWRVRLEWMDGRMDGTTHSTRNHLTFV